MKTGRITESTVLTPSKREMSCIRYILLKKVPKGKDLKPQTVTRFYRKHLVALRWVGRSVRSHGFRLAPVDAALLRAYYSEDHDRLSEFTVILQSGFTDEKKNTSALRLRTLLLKRKPGKMHVPQQDEVYKKTEVALKHFLDGKDIANLYATQAEGEQIFSLPEEKCAEGDKKVPKEAKPEKSE
ncbi:MAG: hypothetical protein CMG78_12025 [Marinobacter sp.]|nr:hypothetical protein [Marinobacter sp.]